MRSALLLAVVASLLLAGCAGARKKAGPEEFTTITSGEGSSDFAEGNSSISGRVLTTKGAPIGGANLTFYRFHARVPSNGSFRFVGLAAGPYVLVADAPSFRAVRQEVEVRSGEHRAVDLILPFISGNTTVYDGEVRCGANYVNCWPPVYMTLGTFGPPYREWYWENVSKSNLPADTIIEVVWTPNTNALDPRLYATIGVSKGHAYAEIEQAQGGSPLTLRVTQAEYRQAFGEDAGEVWFAVGAGEGEAVVNQAFKVYRTEFRNETAPAGFHARP